VILGKKVVVVMPAYNAEHTLETTYREIPFDYVDETVLVDDASSDGTLGVAKRLGIATVLHPRNQGYGANQKTCYREALRRGADIVVMVHPDYQYSPKLIVAMASMIASDIYDVVLGSRILCQNPLRGGMPLYKYAANRFLTLVQNLALGGKLSEYHTGYRAFHRRVLENMPLEANSNDFVFDNQFLTQAVFFGYRIGEISCPTKYFPEASSANFTRSLRYGLGVLATSLKYLLEKGGIRHFPIFTTRRAAGSARYFLDRPG
jgi:glycosyltransferase involved in cell wall biosynthesis